MPGPSVLVRFLADTKDLRKAADEGGKSMSGFQKTALKTAGAIGGAFAATKAVEFTQDAIASASDLNESMSKVQVVFGNSTKSVQDFAKNSATSMGLSQQAALEATATYGNLAVALGLPQDKAATMSTSLVKLAGDLASFNNVSPQEALDALKSGLTGEVEPLRKFGVSLSATQVQAEALRLGLAKAPVDMVKVNQATMSLSESQGKAAAATKKYGAGSQQAKKAQLDVASAQEKLDKAMAGGTVTLTAAQKAQATYALIMEQTKTAQGDFSRTSGGLANQQRIAAAQFENLKATLGTALLPVVVKLAGVFTRDLMPVIKAFADFVSKNASWLLPLAGAILAIVAAVKIWTFVQGILNVVLAANPIVLIIAAVALLVAGIVFLATKTQFFQRVWAGVQQAFAAVWNWVKTYWPLLLTLLLGPIGLAAALIIRHWDGVTGAFKGAWNWLRNTWSTVQGYITRPVLAAVDAIRQAFDTVVEHIKQLFHDLSPGNLIKKGGGFLGKVASAISLDQGGVITSEGLAYVHAGETVVPAGHPFPQPPHGPAVHIQTAYFNNPVDVDLLTKRVEFAISAGLPI